MTINPQRAALPYQRRPAAQRNREAPSLVETIPSVSPPPRRTPLA